ncbi:MAG: response regulator transcription factor [Flavobacteriaceae bacterium]
MSKKNILIVEDEVLIANQIEMFLEFNGYNSVGIAVDYTGAIELLEKKSVDLILLDIKINGSKNGIDLAKYINQKLGLPFLFLTSYNDPVGYINKPINDATLLTNIDLYFSSTKTRTEHIVPIQSGTKTYNINCTELQYIESEHVYINLFFTNHKQSIRISLTKFLEQLPNKELVKISRSIAINPNIIKQISKSKLKINDKIFKISDKYKSNLTS